MINSIIPSFLLSSEDIITLKDKGIRIQEGNQVIGKFKIACYKIFNLNENQVFDQLESNSLLEAESSTEAVSYASRVASILFLRIRQVSTMKDLDNKVIAATSLLSAVNSLASINLQYAKRFLPLVRGLV